MGDAGETLLQDFGLKLRGGPNKDGNTPSTSLAASEGMARSGIADFMHCNCGSVTGKMGF